MASTHNNEMPSAPVWWYKKAGFGKYLNSILKQLCNSIHTNKTPQSMHIPRYTKEGHYE